MAAVRRLVHMPELWNNLAASIMRSRLAYTTVPTTRGGRFAASSSNAPDLDKEAAKARAKAKAKA